MTAAIGQEEPADEDQRKGLALLRLMAEAADAREESQHWVNRRVEQLEFLDVRAVRWRVSVDFNVPETAQATGADGQEYRLVPLTGWEKDNLVAFDLRDETGKTLWLPTSAETARVVGAVRGISAVRCRPDRLPDPPERARADHGHRSEGTTGRACRRAGSA